MNPLKDNCFSVLFSSTGSGEPIGRGPSQSPHGEGDGHASKFRRVRDGFQVQKRRQDGARGEVPDLVEMDVQLRSGNTERVK